jgi:hypothetical protein
VNQPDKHDGQFVFDLVFLIAFGIIAVWSCVTETVPELLGRLMWFTGTAMALDCRLLRLRACSQGAPQAVYVQVSLVARGQLITAIGIWSGEGPVASAAPDDPRAVSGIPMVVDGVLCLGPAAVSGFVAPAQISRAARQRRGAALVRHDDIAPMPPVSSVGRKTVTLSGLAKAIVGK